jgi:hypothetical protein
VELILFSKKKKIERKKFTLNINNTSFKYTSKKKLFFTKILKKKKNKISNKKAVKKI